MFSSKKLVLTLCAAGIATISGCTTKTSSTEKNPIFGRINGTDIKTSDLTSSEQSQIYSVEQQVYQSAQRILEMRYVDVWFKDYQVQNKFPSLEAAKQDYFAKNSNVTDVQVNDFIKQNAANPQVKQIPAKELPGIVKQYLTRMSQAKLEQKIVQDGKSAGKLTLIAYKQPLAPVIQFTTKGYVKNPSLTNAKLTVTEFADYQCPYCVQAYPIIKNVLAQFSTQVQFVFHDFPLQFHAQAMPAAIAASCADKQNKYWEMHDKLFSRSPSIEPKPDFIMQIAKDLALNIPDFNTCLKNPAQQAKVQADYQTGVVAGVEGTPALFINGRKFDQQITAESLTAAINEGLKDGSSK